MPLHTSGPSLTKGEALDALEALPIDCHIAADPVTGRCVDVGHLHYLVALDRMSPATAATYLVLAGLPLGSVSS